MLRKQILTAFLWCFCCVFSVTAGVVPKATFYFKPAGFKGDSTRLILHVSLPQGWHIQSNTPLDSFLIPTTVKATAEGVVFGSAAFPKPVEKDYPALGGKVALFEGEFDIAVPAKRANAKVKSSALKSVKVKLGYQACNDSQCLPPKEVDAVYELPRL